MCSNPQEMTVKGTGEVVTVACRACNECLATRRHGWVARAMAEKADCAHAACVTLTYGSETQQARDGAQMFQYRDVNDFLKRLRSAARYEARKQKWNFEPVVRFLCAGEQGERNGRCHWHIILYTNFDLSRIGKFRLRGKLVTHRRDMITVGKVKRRLNWALWEHGFMTLQEPDQAAMNYVLSYCLKDQFTIDRSTGTMREAKAENFATGLFRMSKFPPIGENWLMQKLQSLLDKGVCLPSLQIRVPGMSGYWQPSGSFRKKLLWGLVALNKRILWATGANAPQWSSLLASCATFDADMEILNGTQKVDGPSPVQKITNLARRLENKALAFDGAKGKPCTCQACLDALDESGLARRGLWRVYVGEGRPARYQRDDDTAGASVVRSWCKYEPDGPTIPRKVGNQG